MIAAASASSALYSTICKLPMLHSSQVQHLEVDGFISDYSDMENIQGDDDIADSELLDFLNVDMPKLFPEIAKEMEGRCNKTEEPAFDTESSSIVKTPLVLKTALLNSIEMIPTLSVPTLITSSHCATTLKRVAPASVSPSPSMSSFDTSSSDVEVSTPPMKKRKTSTSSPSSVEDNMTTTKSKKTAKQIMEERKQRNREHARKSRAKRKSKEVDLKESIEQMKQENLKLRQQVYEMIGGDDNDNDTDNKKKLTIDNMVQEHVNRSTVNFIKAVKRPENRVVDVNTIKFLQSRSKKLTTDSKKSSNSKAMAVIG